METMRPCTRDHLKNQRGMTMAELLAAMVIGGVLVTLVFRFMTAGTDAFLQNREASEMQQELRWAMQFVTQHVKMAGNIVPQVLIDDTGYKVIDNFDGAGGAPDSLSILGSFRSVVITLDQHMGNEGAQVKCSDKSNTPPLPLDELFSVLDLAFISDGTFSEVFQITKIEADHLFHMPSPPWNDDNKLDHRYVAGSTLSVITHYSFFVANDDEGHPNLMVQTQAYPAQLLAGDIEEFQIRFMMKSGDWQDEIDSSEITLNEIRRVEISMRARSHDPIKGYRDATYGDGYKRQELKSIVIPKSITVL